MKKPRKRRSVIVHPSPKPGVPASCVELKNIVRRFLSVLSLSLIALAAIAADDSASPDTAIWRKVRADLFGDRPLADDATTGTIVLEMPARAADAAVVPLAVRVRSSPGDAPIKKLYVVIDPNSSPISGIFEFGEGSAGPEPGTRGRLEEDTQESV